MSCAHIHYVAVERYQSCSAFEAISKTLSDSPFVSTILCSSLFIIACLSLSYCRQLVKHDTNLEATWLLIWSTCTVIKQTLKTLIVEESNAYVHTI